MTQFRRCPIGLLILTASLAGVSCSHDGAPLSAGPPASREAPGSVAQWTQLSREETCSPPNNAPLCLDGLFRVTREGTFSFDGTPGQGAITPAELASLIRVGDAAASQDLGSDPICRQDQVSIPEISGIEIKLTYTDGSEVTLLQTGRAGSNQGKCFHGQEAQADDLNVQLSGLVRHYSSPPGSATHTVLNPLVGGE